MASSYDGGMSFKRAEPWRSTPNLFFDVNLWMQVNVSFNGSPSFAKSHLVSSASYDFGDTRFSLRTLVGYVAKFFPITHLPTLFLYFSNSVSSFGLLYADAVSPLPPICEQVAIIMQKSVTRTTRHPQDLKLCCFFFLFAARL